MKTCNCGKNNCILLDENCNIIVNDNTFNYDYIQVFILKLANLPEDTQTIIKDSRNKRVAFKSKGDGFYTICKLTIPIDTTSYYYYMDGKFYHNIKEVSLLDILDTDPKVSGIEFEYIYYFSTCYLKKCFIKTCLEIFNSSNSICNKSGVDGSLIYKRDLLWSTLNVINYMVETNLMEEALKLLEKITECNGLCYSKPNFNNNNCGCGK